MKKEKEISWVVNLLNNTKLSNSFFKKGGGCIKEFESTANNSYKDKEFRKWFKEMIDSEIITFSDSINNSKGNPTKIYILDKSKMIKYMKTFEFYKKLSNVVTIIE